MQQQMEHRGLIMAKNADTRKLVVKQSFREMAAQTRKEQQQILIDKLAQKGDFTMSHP